MGVLGKACTHLVWKGPQKGGYCLIYTPLTLLSSLVLKAQARGGGKKGKGEGKKEGGRENGRTKKERKEEEKGVEKEWKGPV